jgi:hypothetical protein
MAVTVRYVPPSEADWARLVNKPQINTAMQRIAAHGVVFAQSISPVDTGEYARSFSIETSSAVISGKPRQAVDLVNDAPHAIFVELRHHVLTRTAGFLGHFLGTPPPAPERTPRRSRGFGEENPDGPNPRRRR